jgi:hypothetical protein
VNFDPGHRAVQSSNDDVRVRVVGVVVIDHFRGRADLLLVV